MQVAVGAMVVAGVIALLQGMAAGLLLLLLLLLVVAFHSFIHVASSRPPARLAAV